MTKNSRAAGRAYGVFYPCACGPVAGDFRPSDHANARWSVGLAKVQTIPLLSVTGAGLRLQKPLSAFVQLGELLRRPRDSRDRRGGDKKV